MIEKINEMERRKNDWNHVFAMMTEAGVWYGEVTRTLTFIQSAGGKHLRALMLVHRKMQWKEPAKVLCSLHLS